MASNDRDETRRPYEAPAAEALGSLDELTLGLEGGDTDLGGFSGDEGTF